MSRVSAITILALFAASAAFAQDQYARNGFYVGLGGTVGVDNFDSGPLEFDASLGLNALAGYRFHPRIAGELQFEWTSDFEGSNNPVDVESRLFTVNGRAYLLTGRVQPNLLAGIGFLNAEASGFGASIDDTGFAARLGAGVDYYVTENLALAFDGSYVFTTGGVDGLDYGSLDWGFRYRF